MGKVRHRPTEKFKQKGDRAVNNVMVSGPGPCGEKQVPLPED